MPADSMFSLPLAGLGILQILLTFVLISPRIVSFPLASLICKAKRNVAVQSAFFTSCLVLAFLFVTGLIEVVRDAKKTHDWDMRDRGELSVIDFLRAQVSCLLCLFNLTLAFVVPALAEANKSIDSQAKNMDAMKRQVKGLQAEYERLTKAGAAGEAKSEGDEWKAKVDRLLREKQEAQDAVEAAAKAKASAEARVEALLQQIKGFDKEYDRVLDENKQLQRRLAQADATFKSSFSEPRKKDD